MRIRLIDSPALPGDFNMACDYLLTRDTNFGDNTVLRLYTWNRPTISLGYHQKADNIDFEKCRGDGIDIVRRPTGGRAILHWGELTYCLIFPVEPGRGREKLKEIYCQAHQAIANALRNAGSKVDFAGAKNKPQPHNPLCFASTAGTELEVGGKKVVGSAQRLFDSAILQHGSILLTDQHLRMPEYLDLPIDRQEALKHQLSAKSGHLEVTDGTSLRRGFADSFSKIFDLEYYRDDLKEGEIIHIDREKCRFKAGFAG